MLQSAKSRRPETLLQNDQVKLDERLQTMFSEQEFCFLLFSFTWVWFSKGGKKNLFFFKVAEPDFLRFLLALDFYDVQLILLVICHPVGMDKFRAKGKEEQPSIPSPALHRKLKIS